MKMLLWKEWRQNRLIFLGGLLISLVYPVIYAAHPHHLGAKPYDVLAGQYVIAILYAALMGAALVGPEIGSGQIGELFRRPVNRWKIWLCKFLFGLLASLAVFFFAELVGLVAAVSVGELSAGSVLRRAMGDIPVAAHLLNLAVVFAFALFGATVARSPLSVAGAVLLLVACAIYWFAWSMLLGVAGWREITENVLPILAPSTGLAVFGGLSALAFAKGQIHTGLRGPMRRLMVWPIGTILLVLVATFAVGYRDLMYLEPGEDYSIRRLSLSPDRSKVAVGAHSRRSYSVNALWVLDLESGKRGFTDAHLAAPFSPGAWSPNGERFAIWTYRGPGLLPIPALFSTRLMLFDLADETVTPLRVVPSAEGWPSSVIAWSQSSDLLYCPLSSEGNLRVEHISVEGIVTRTLPLGPDWVFRFDLVAGDPPVFVCRLAQPMRPGEPAPLHVVYALIDANTGDTRKIDLGRKDQVARYIGISPDGKHTLYAKYDRPLEERETYPEAEKPPARLFLRDIATGTDTPILHHKAWRVRASRGEPFSPDGTRFVLYDLREVEGKRDSFDLYAVNIPEDTATLVIENIARQHRWGPLRWSPDGTKIAIAVGQPRNERADLVVAHPDGPEATRNSVATGAVTAFVWLSDEELLYADGNALYRVNIDGTGRQKVFP